MARRRASRGRVARSLARSFAFKRTEQTRAERDALGAKCVGKD